MTNSKSVTTYQKLVAELSGWIDATTKTGSQALNEDRLDAYWRIGRRLNRLKRQEPVLTNRLAKDLKVRPILLYRAHALFQTWGDGLTRDAKRLAWRSHLVLAGIQDAKKRDFYVTTALERGWNRDALHRAITRDFFTAHRGNTAADAPFARKETGFLFKAEVKKVIDGDSLLVHVDLGFNTWTMQKLRLRGIDTAELATPDKPAADEKLARKAKAFVTDKVGGRLVVIRSHKTDKYGRFVVDVFYHPDLDDKQDIASKGFFLNEELLRAGLARRAE